MALAGGLGLPERCWTPGVASRRTARVLAARQQLSTFVIVVLIPAALHG